MNPLDKPNLPKPPRRGTSRPDSSHLVKQEPPVWDSPHLVNLARLNDKRLESVGALKNMQNETQPKTANGLPPEARTHKLRRTLFIAGVFALLAMIYVPAPAQQHPFSRPHYRFIFSQDETGIAFFQLLVNIAFAAIVGALAANIPKRFFVWFRRCFLSTARCDCLFYRDCHSHIRKLSGHASTSNGAG